MNEERLRELYAGTIAARAGICPPPEDLLALVRRDGAEDDRLATLDHVMSCERCRREFDLLRSIERAGREAEAEPEPPAEAPAPAETRVVSLASRRRAWFVPAAIAATLLLAVFLGRQAFEPTGIDTFRSGGDAVTLLEPPAAATAGSVVFAWRPVRDADRYQLEVLRADGTVVLDEQTADTVVAPAAAATLPPGEYRWWVRALAPGGELRSPMRDLTIRPPE